VRFLAGIRRQNQLILHVPTERFDARGLLEISTFKVGVKNEVVTHHDAAKHVRVRITVDHFPRRPRGPRKLFLELVNTSLNGVRLTCNRKMQQISRTNFKSDTQLQWSAPTAAVGAWQASLGSSADGYHNRLSNGALDSVSMRDGTPVRAVVTAVGDPSMPKPLLKNNPATVWLFLVTTNANTK
jgi:hypothetical protein